ncbi:MAG: hypothetical protein IPN79_05960 [Saprospiraceae bacterium]|nr:hypothetical protein [Saprospiraceae bacterium]
MKRNKYAKLTFGYKTSYRNASSNTVIRVLPSEPAFRQIFDFYVSLCL